MVVSRIFRKKVCRPWHERSQPAMEVSSRVASKCFMFILHVALLEVGNME